MSQSSKPQKLRTNAALACNNCRASHRKCKKPSEEDICAYCRNHRLHCTYTLGGKRGPKPRYSKLRSHFNSSFHKPNIEEFQFFALNFGTSLLYNDVITTPFRTTEVFINKEPTLNYQNITPINPNKANIEEFQSFYSNFETTPSFKTTETFIGQGLMSNNNPKPRQSTLMRVPLKNSNSSSYLNFEITHAQTIGTTEAFIDQGLMLNNPNTTPFNSYEIATEEFQSPY
ncbi:15807_t:CDS:2 [Cetraspora pellucida]|uniref:15807_t:CDS:1 n=1 Tax=Cetraspora pellucida TaxID=1433469 RepID=A0ACA9M3M0_9GLOM|nr:15807_t:CDS:2 [Cetraspora pellucida]